MRVEQRIGRIDRVGQKADRLVIANFKVKDTVEERLHDRLHSKLLMFANTLGDLEMVIGEEVQKLTIDLLSRNLTPAEEQARIEDAERVLHDRILQLQNLEESGESLVALSDYVQKKIREDREKGRYVQAEELEDYLCDFFNREFHGTDLEHNTPHDGCIRLRLSAEARSSLNEFIKDDHSLAARPLRQREIVFTLRKDVHRDLPPSSRKTVHFINHLSPLVRWMTHQNQSRSHAFFNVSASILQDEALPAGDYCYRIERWTLRGLSIKENMAYAVIPINDQAPLDASRAERVVQDVLRKGKSWDYVDCNLADLRLAHEKLKEDLGVRFSEAVEDFQAENNTTVQIRVQRARNHWDRLIGQSEKAIQTMRMAGRDDKFIRARETRLRNERDNRADQIQKLEQGTEIDPEPGEVAAGTFRVVHPKPSN
jgi:hypothetical protein